MTPQDLVLTKAGVRFLGRMFPCTIGRSGLVRAKKEGDGATPTGVHRIVGMFHRPDRIAAPQPWSRAIGPRDLWSDDPNSPDYNQHVCAPYSFSHENLRRADPLYDLVLVTDWNWHNPVPENGSAIFIHQQRRSGYPTEGCIAFDRRDLRWIAERIVLGNRVFVPHQLIH